MQLPAEEELVLVSGRPPIRARKLRYFRDRNFSERVLPAPTLADGGYRDRPASRLDDWSGRVRAPHGFLTAGAGDPWTSIDAEEEGGLQHHLPLDVDASKQVPDNEKNVMDLVEEDFDTPSAAGEADPAKRLTPVQRAHGVNQGQDRDVLPAL